MKSYHVYPILAIGVVVAILIAVYYRNRNVGRLRYSALSNADNDALRTMFIEATNVRFQEIADCVAKKLFDQHTYDQAVELITEDNFKNNPSVKNILDSCTLNVLRSLYAIVIASMSNECAKKNPQAVIKWVLENVEYRVHTEAEVAEILKNINRELTNVCWSDGDTKVVIAFTAPRILSLVAETIDERLREPLLSTPKYTEWAEYIATIAVHRYRDAGGRSDVYLANLEKMTGADFDSLSDNGFAKIYIQAQIANTLFSGWCKGIPELIKALDPVEIRIYTEEEAGQIMANISKQWCWNPAMLAGRAQDTLQKTF